MSSLFNFPLRVIRSLIKLLLVVFAFAMVIGLLLVGLVVALLSILWSLVRGRKPSAATVFHRFSQTSQQFRKRSDAADIVDVQAHEVSAPTKKIE
jgi:hypothetical protein